MRVPSVAVVVAVVAASAQARAQTTKGKFHLGMESGVYMTESITLSPQDSTSGSEVTATESSAGLFGTALGVRAGVGIGDYVVLDGRLLQGTTTRSYEHDVSPEAQTSAFMLLPSIEAAFSPGRVARPFIAGVFGWRSLSSTIGGTEVSSSSLVVYGASAGVHVFGAPSFSIDPSLTVLGVAGTETTRDSIDPSFTAKFDRSGIAVLVTVALSGWLGGGSNEATAPPPASSPTDTTETTEEAPSDYSVSERPSLAVSQGIVATSVPLPEGTVLRLSGRPAENGNDILLRIVAPSDSHTIAQCEAIDLDVGGEKHHFDAVKHGNESAGFERQPYLQTRIDALTVRAIGLATTQVKISACGAEWVLEAAERRRVQEYFTAFHAQADKAGTWHPEGSTPPAAAPEPATPSEAPPPSEPVPSPPEDKP